MQYLEGIENLDFLQAAYPVVEITYLAEPSFSLGENKYPTDILTYNYVVGYLVKQTGRDDIPENRLEQHNKFVSLNGMVDLTNNDKPGWCYMVATNSREHIHLPDYMNTKHTNKNKRTQNDIIVRDVFYKIHNSTIINFTYLKLPTLEQVEKG